MLLEKKIFVKNKFYEENKFRQKYFFQKFSEVPNFKYFPKVM